MKRLEPSPNLQNSDDVFDNCDPTLKKVKTKIVPSQRTTTATTDVPRINPNSIEQKNFPSNDLKKFMVPANRAEEQKVEVIKELRKDVDEEGMESEKENEIKQQKVDRSSAQEARNSSPFEVEDKFDISLGANAKILESRKFDLSLKNIKEMGANTLEFADKYPDGFQNFTIFAFYNQILSMILTMIKELFPKDFTKNLDLQYGDCNQFLRQLENKDDLKYTILLNIHKGKNTPRLPIFVFKVQTHSIEEEKKLLEEYFHQLNKNSKLPIYGLLSNQHKSVFISFDDKGQPELKYSRVIDHCLNDYEDQKEPSPAMKEFHKKTAAIIAKSIQNFRN